MGGSWKCEDTRGTCELPPGLVAQWQNCRLIDSFIYKYVQSATKEQGELAQPFMKCVFGVWIHEVVNSQDSVHHLVILKEAEYF